jgi:hypothetical protein
VRRFCASIHRWRLFDNMEEVDVRKLRPCTNEANEEGLDARTDIRRGEVDVGRIGGSRRCTFRKRSLRVRIRSVKERTFRVNRRTLRTPGILHPTAMRLVRRLGGSGALAPPLDSGREYRLMCEKEPSERAMKCRLNGLGQGEYGSVLT